MKLCNCSHRPLGILESRVVMEDGVPYQVLGFGCTNKHCVEYKKVKWHRYINLLDNSRVFDKEVV